MKINFKLLKWLIFLYMFSNICENLITYCSKSTLGVAFKSNFQLMVDKKKSKRDGGNAEKPATEGEATPQPVVKAANEAKKDEACDSTANKKSNRSSYINSGQSSPFQTQSGFHVSPIPDIPILFQSWAKYFSYRTDGNNKPNNFFVNDDWETQSEEEKNSKEKDEVKIKY